MFPGSLFTHGVTRSSEAVHELDEIPSRWALCSGRHDEKVFDGLPGGNSPFAESILDVLKRNKNEMFHIGKLANTVIEQTRSNYDQLPEGSPLFGVGHKGGQFIFQLKNGEQSQKQVDVQSSKQVATEKVEYSKVEASNKRQRIVSHPWIIALAVLVFGMVGWIALKGTFERPDHFIQVYDASMNRYEAILIGDHYWLTDDVEVDVEDEEDHFLFQDPNCAADNKLGKLYSFEAGRLACCMLDGNWRLPSNDEWKALAGHFGGFDKKDQKIDVWYADKVTGGALFQVGESGVDLKLKGFLVNSTNEFSPPSRGSNRTHGYYWIAEKGRFVIERFNDDINVELLAQPVQRDHAYGCRCVKDYP